MCCSRSKEKRLKKEQVVKVLTAAKRSSKKWRLLMDFQPSSEAISHPARWYGWKPGEEYKGIQGE